MVDTETVFCKVCHRKLKNPAYKKIGMGKICYDRYKTQEKNYLFEVNKKDEIITKNRI